MGTKVLIKKRSTNFFSTKFSVSVCKIILVTAGSKIWEFYNTIKFYNWNHKNQVPLPIENKTKIIWVIIKILVIQIVKNSNYSQKYINKSNL